MKQNPDLTSIIHRYVRKEFSELQNAHITKDCLNVKSALEQTLENNDQLLFKSHVVDTDNLNEIHIPEYFILEYVGEVSIISNKNGVFLDETHKEVKIDEMNGYTIYFINREIKEASASEIMAMLIKQTPIASFFMIILVAFVLVSPVYSNIFNSRLVHASSMSTLVVVSSMFFAIFSLEFLLKEFIMKSVNSKIENLSKQAEMAFYEFTLNSSSKDAIINWKTASDSVTSLWRGFGYIFLDLSTILFIIIALCFELGVYAIFPVLTYVLLFAISVGFKIKSYKRILAISEIKDQKLTYLMNIMSSNSFLKFVDKESIKDKWRKMVNENATVSLETQNNEEFYSGALKLYASTSIITIFIASYCAIQTGSCDQSSIIALMLLNGRCSSALTSIINKTYSSVIAHSKMKSSLESLLKQKINHQPHKQGLSLPRATPLSILIKNVTKKHGETTALSIDNTVKMVAGECWCISGSVGSGKTTLLNIISGKSTATTGSVLLNSINIKDFSPLMFIKDVAYYSINDHMIGDTLDFNMNLKYGFNNDAAVNNLIYFDCDFALTKEIMFETPATDFKLSSGQIQKINMVRSLGDSPKLIVMDEPCSNLSNHEARLFIKKLKDRYVDSIIVIATHNPVVRNLADKVWDIENNEITTKQ